ncbi:hypothetical protein G7Z17_g1289 [Cylindrodendrum hubeiense]|uniref:Uncharacterized protein n=1 Tax=Cylindrodendrum hubeiense TaxID=595255 RepID=A0A9P5LCK4_9HYPO|nr:hypothetical protein G7Z17_g1289 [Cylindrodendrum hubeiense]
MADASPPAGLFLVYEPDTQEPVVDIVIIHGLKGHAYKTWTSPLMPDAVVDPPAEYLLDEPDIVAPRLGQILRTVTTLMGWASNPRRLGSVPKPKMPVPTLFWPGDLLPQDCPKARILTYGYDTKITKYIVIFGLHPDELNNIVKSTAAVVFLGTPHRGSPDLSALGAWARSVLSAFRFQTTSRILDILGLKTTDLERSQESFSGLWFKYNFRVKTFQEAFGLRGINLGVLGNKVVPDTSSLIEDQREHAETFQTNHMDMCRFTGRDDPNFVKVVGELRSIYLSILTGALNPKQRSTPGEPRSTMLNTTGQNSSEEFNVDEKACL